MDDIQLWRGLVKAESNWRPHLDSRVGINEVAWLCKLAAQLQNAVVDEVGCKDDITVPVQGEVTGRLHAGGERMQRITTDIYGNNLHTGGQGKNPLHLFPRSKSATS